MLQLYVSLAYSLAVTVVKPPELLPNCNQENRVSVSRFRATLKHTAKHGAEM